MMEVSQLRALIRCVLDKEDLGGRSVSELLMLTAAQESHLGKYIRQLDDGPARGIFQIEKNTEKLVWKWAIKSSDHFFQLLRKYCTGTEYDLEANLPYQIILGRLNYYSWPSPIPEITWPIDENGIHALAGYWKKYWNTQYGAGTVEEAVNNYKRFVHEG